MIKTTTLSILFSFIFLFNSSASDCIYLKSKTAKIDTSKIFYFSFVLDKVVEYEIESLSNPKIEVCTGQKVLLEAPNPGFDSFFLWEGPNGFRSYQANILFENVASSQGGTYTIRELSNLNNITGNIELVIKEAPPIQYKIDKKGKAINISLVSNNENTSYEWKDDKSLVIGSGKKIELPLQTKSIHIYAQRDGCLSKKTINL